MAKTEQRFIKVMGESASGGLTGLVDAEGKPLLYHKTPDAPEF